MLASRSVGRPEMFLVAHCTLLLSALSAVRSACPGSPWREWRGHCYRLTPKAVTWHGFRAECKSPFRRADVVSIENRAEQNYIRSMAARRNIWLGMRSHGETEPVWADGSPVTFTNFAKTSGEGSRVSRTGNVVRMIGRSAKWELVSSYDPSMKLFGVCKMDSCSCPSGWRRYSNNCNKVVAKRLGWVEARQHCQRIAPAADLAMVRNAWESNFLYRLAGRIPTVWIGLNDREKEGAYGWSGQGKSLTGAKSFKRWHRGRGEPNGTQHREDCAAVKKDMTWADHSCDTTVTGEKFICQQSMCGRDGDILEEQTRIGPVRIWRPEDGVRCPVGWSRSGRKCLKHLAQRDTYAGVRTLCKTLLKGEIAVIDTLKDNDMAWLVTDQLPVWITTHWIQEQGKRSGQTVCVTMEKSGRWRQLSCGAQRPVLCQTPACDPKCPAGWSQFKGHCYRVENTKQKTTDAEAACKEAGGHLASIQTQDENDYIQTLAFPYSSIDELNRDQSTRLVWIGASRASKDSAWSWNDCANWTMSRWIGTDELNPPSDHTCALMTMAGRWKGSALCGDQSFRFVCKLDPCVRQFGPVDGSGCSGDY